MCATTCETDLRLYHLRVSGEYKCVEVPTLND